MKEAESKIRFIVILVFNCFEKAVEESIYIYMNDGFFSGLVFYSLSLAFTEASTQNSWLETLKRVE